MSGMLVDRVKAEQTAMVRRAVQKIAHDSPQLEHLPEDVLERLTNQVMIEGMRDELKRAALLEKIPYQEELDKFLGRAGGSGRTQKIYAAAIERLQTWCDERHISRLELTPANADDWIESEKALGRASATVRLAVSAASCFWTWLERRHKELRNPFRGTRARPKNEAVRVLAVPSSEEVATLKETPDLVLRGAVAVMAGLGLRIGGLPGLAIRGESWTTLSKGKKNSGTITEDLRRELERCGLSLRAPFEGWTAERLTGRFRYLVKGLLKDGKLRAAYSVHDLRHHFATILYQATDDIYAVKEALCHANVGVTETYLRSLGLKNGNGA